jgi:hypothetical protein
VQKQEMKGPWRKQVATAGIFASVMMFSTVVMGAGSSVIDPDFESLLKEAGPNQKLSVIITFT